MYVRSDCRVQNIRLADMRTVGFIKRIREIMRMRIHEDTSSTIGRNRRNEKKDKTQFEHVLGARRDRTQR